MYQKVQTHAIPKLYITGNVACHTRAFAQVQRGEPLNLNAIVPAVVRPHLCADPAG